MTWVETNVPEQPPKLVNLDHLHKVCLEDDTILGYRSTISGTIQVVELYQGDDVAHAWADLVGRVTRRELRNYRVTADIKPDWNFYA